MARDNDPSHLHPTLRARVKHLEGLLETRGLPFILYEGYRGKERQEAGVKRGKSKARFGQSYHNYGLAVDFVGDKVVTGLNPWDNSLPWKEYGKAVEDSGLSWAGRWTTFRELVHCDCAVIYPWSFLREARHLPPSVDGMGKFVAFWLPEVMHEHFGIAAWQRALTIGGYVPGPVDGWWGRKTQRATEAAFKGAGLPSLDYTSKNVRTVLKTVYDDWRSA